MHLWRHATNLLANTNVILVSALFPKNSQYFPAVLVGFTRNFCVMHGDRWNLILLYITRYQCKIWGFHGGDYEE
jgi:hypothetical protein